MKIAIHKRHGDFSSKWIAFCEAKKIQYKIVNCYSNSIISDLKDCNALMWHFHQSDPKDVLFAKELIYALQSSGLSVFPDFNTCWHFDDKVGQKYLLEAVGAPFVPSYVFYDKESALKWVNETEFPKVFKLRRGSGSSHVKLVHNRGEAIRMVKKAFGAGFSQYDKKANLIERWRKYQQGKSGLTGVLKGIIRFGYTTEFARTVGNEKGYIYFQDFIPGNKFDIRVIVINGKACAVKRFNRKNDFRASGSGNFQHAKENFDEDMIKQSFAIAKRINSKSLAIDYVYDRGKPLIIELSYGFPSGPFVEDCPGYWDNSMNWHAGTFSAQGWMVESVVEDIKSKK